MKRLSVASVIVVFIACSTMAFASLYSWNDVKRPPMSLVEAISKAEQLLGDDAVNRYCVSVHLYGDETGEGKEGAWNLFYAATDGSKKHVYMNMQGKAEVTLWNGPIDWKKNSGRRASLADVRRRLEELFSKEGLAAQFVVDDDLLTVTHRTRIFEVHPYREGDYADKLEQILGPDSAGIWLRIQAVDKPDPRMDDYADGPYWRWLRGTYFLSEPGKFLSVDLRYGPKVKYEIIRQVWQIFGDRTPRR
jgi:hypothetical protein